MVAGCLLPPPTGGLVIGLLPGLLTTSRWLTTSSSSVPSSPQSLSRLPCSMLIPGCCPAGSEPWSVARWTATAPCAPAYPSTGLGEQGRRTAAPASPAHPAQPAGQGGSRIRYRFARSPAAPCRRAAGPGEGSCHPAGMVPAVAARTYGYRRQPWSASGRRRRRVAARQGRCLPAGSREIGECFTTSPGCPRSQASCPRAHVPGAGRGSP